jgi:hypothetical protein
VKTVDVLGRAVTVTAEELNMGNIYIGLIKITKKIYTQNFPQENVSEERACRFMKQRFVLNYPKLKTDTPPPNITWPECRISKRKDLF